MAILTKEKLATYGIEVLVVVFGILIAFQVDEWREDRQRSRDLDAALIRLAEETAANLRACELVVPILANHARSVVVVVRALNDGHLSDANIESFDAGLIRVGYVTGVPFSETVAAEMIATGMLKDLENAELRNRVATLPVFIEGARTWEYDPRGVGDGLGVGRNDGLGADGRAGALDAAEVAGVVVYYGDHVVARSFLP